MERLLGVLRLNEGKLDLELLRTSAEEVGGVELLKKAIEESVV